MSADNGLTIESSPSGRNGQATLTARLNGEPIAVDTFSLTKDKDRAAFVAKVCDGRRGIDKATVEAQLLGLAAEVASKPEGQPAPDTLPEVDVSAIIRPERFVTPEVSGLAVAAMTAIGDTPTGRWLLYLRWADGRRECRPMPHCLDLPGGRRLWIHPTPCEPTAHTPRGWSADARRRWLTGEPTPDPAEVFKAVAERFAYYLDFPKD
jgi:hypothetical protein